MKKNLKLFRQIVTVEIVKLRGTFAFWLTLLYPLGTVFLVTLFWISRRNNKSINPDEFSSNLGDVASFFLPFFIVLIISFACNTEHKSSMLKHLLSLPVPRPLMYLGKFSGILIFIFFALLLSVALAYFSLLVCGLIFPRLSIGESFNHLLLIRKLLKAYFAAAAIYSIQFWFGMRLRNITLPVAIGSTLIILPVAILIIMGITGLVTKIENFTKIITYNPYSFPYSSAFNLVKSTEIHIFTTPTLVYMVISVLVLLAGVWEFGRRDVR